MLNLVTSGAGFLGSHLVNALVDDGERVIIIDDLENGHVRNLEHGLSSGRVTFVYGDAAVSYRQLATLIGDATKERIHRIYHLVPADGENAAARGSWRALRAHSVATLSLIDLALAHGARFLFASTSGELEKLAGTQPETGTSWAACAPFAESAVAIAVRERSLEGRIARIFECYGPGMAYGDGVVANLFEAVLEGRQQVDVNHCDTVAPVYVGDAVRLLRIVMERTFSTLTPVNIVSDEEHTIENLAVLLASLTGGEIPTLRVATNGLRDSQRRSDLLRLRELGWAPATRLEDGLRTTYRWFRDARLAFA